MSCVGNWHLCAQVGALVSRRARLGSVRRARHRGERRVREAPRVGLAALGAGGDALPVPRARLHVRLGRRLARSGSGSSSRSGSGSGSSAALSESESVRGHVGARALAVLVALVRLRVHGARVLVLVLALASTAAARARADVLAAVDGPHESTAVLASPSAAVAFSRFLLLLLVFYLCLTTNTCVFVFLCSCLLVFLCSRFLPSGAPIRNNTNRKSSRE